MDLRSRDLNIPKKIRELSLHNYIGLLSVFLLVIIDSFFLGQMGEMELATSIFASPLIFFFVNVFSGASNAKMVFLSKNIDLEKKELLKHSNYIDKRILFFYVVCATLLILNLTSVLDLFNSSQELKEKSWNYIVIHYIGAFFCVYNALAASYLRALGDSKLPARVMMISALFNLALDPLFIFHFGLGSDGAAIATALAWFGSSLFYVYKIKKANNFVFKSSKINLRPFLSMVPSFSVQQVLNPLSVLFIYYYLSQFGMEIVTGMGFGIRLDKFAVIVGFAFASSISVFAGQNIKDLNRSIQGYKATLIQGICTSIVVSSMLYVFNEQIADLFMITGDSRNFMKTFLLFSILTSSLTTMYVINASFLNATDNHNAVFKCNVFKTLITLPLFLYGFIHFLGWEGVLYGLLLNVIFSNVLVLCLSNKEVRMSMIRSWNPRHKNKIDNEMEAVSIKI